MVDVPQKLFFFLEKTWIVQAKHNKFILVASRMTCLQSRCRTSTTCLKMSLLKFNTRASLVAQWLRICLTMNGTRVRALVLEDLTCRRATKPVCHNYWACALEPASYNYWVCVPQLLKPPCLAPVAPQQEKPPQWEACASHWRVASPCSLQLEKACAQQRRQPKINK